eukprot:3996708-Pyramimonas_sp.AAC.1
MRAAPRKHGPTHNADGDIHEAASVPAAHQGEGNLRQTQTPDVMFLSQRGPRELSTHSPGSAFHPE